MKIAKPVLLVTTPIGVVLGIYEGFRLTGGLALIILAQVLLFGAACLMLVRMVRKEQRAGAAGPPEEGAAAASVAAVPENPRSSWSRP